ncbi:MAG TPA: type II secretion system inner membrane protein GspF [Nitrospirota bacterium]|nr:type II secretion system inner membrane protein GspF [Nitrospirota bacterium]
MPVYEYKGVTSRGKKISGVHDGESLKAVKMKLKKEGIIVLEINEGESSTRVASLGTVPFSFGNRVKLIDLANATRQLATLLSSGLPLMESLSVLVEQEETAALKRALSSVRDDVREGASLTDALKANQKAFSQLYINMVSAGEASGTLEITLDRLADFLDEQVRFRGRILAALAYPAFMTIIGIGMLFFIFSFVMPRVVGMFEDMKQQLPFITIMLLFVVRFLSSFWWMILLTLAGAVYYIRKYISTPAGRAMLDSNLLRLPIFGGLIRMIAVSRFTRTLGTLLQGGVPTLTALDIVKSVVGNTVLADAVQKARENVREGEPIADPLRRSGLFPPVVVQMVAVGEKSGELEKMLLKISNSFDRTVETRITGLMALMEPVIILVMGLVIGFVVIAIMLPMLEMSSGVK